MDLLYIENSLALNNQENGNYIQRKTVGEKKNLVHYYIVQKLNATYGLDRKDSKESKQTFTAAENFL